MDWKKAQPNPLMMATLLGLTAIATPAIAQTAPTRPAPAAASPAPVRVDEGYLLGSGDRVKIDIFGVPEYSGEYQVMSDGSINLPLAGGVVVQGLTMRQASDTLARRYSEYLTRPVITVSLLTARPIQVAVSGEVARPGTYTTTLGDVGIPTLSRMVQMAGGIKQSADLKQVEIVRRRPGGGGTQTFKVDLAKLLRGGDLGQDVQLRDGDSVYVPAAAALNFDQSSELANSSLGASFDRPISIIVAGEVNRPGPQTVRGETIAVSDTGATTPAPGATTAAQRLRAPTVTRALQQAGGITQRANIRDIEVRRTVSNGTEQTIKVNLMSLLREGDGKQDIILQEGDRVIVPLATASITPEDAAIMGRGVISPELITVNVVGQVEKPGAVQVPPYTTMNQALLAAGGFARGARKSSVEFIRLQPNGAVDRRRVDIDFSRGIDQAKNPPLQAGDTIVVGKTGLQSVAEGIGSFLGPALGIFGIFR
ncbi:MULTISPECIES: polysaccharide biosynthesis/export family protein [Leptolyngbya]|uniref:polysaccharide biosynthesis/export family protein n=1 Tax=Leptolyngbya TaxID=47251 RepID=UPI001688CD5A|nr:SLBB domain-containing protein [Leptolyngbya sp. FACHB-1624]MBD1857794.1 SLBB domain-containing protein [Leptolyngbya sp. FACHB-1624]